MMVADVAATVAVDATLAVAKKHSAKQSSFLGALFTFVSKI